MPRYRDKYDVAVAITAGLILALWWLIQWCIDTASR